jgi:hypothetical protein
MLLFVKIFDQVIVTVQEKELTIFRYNSTSTAFVLFILKNKIPIIQTTIFCRIILKNINYL